MPDTSSADFRFEVILICARVFGAMLAVGFGTLVVLKVVLKNSRPGRLTRSCIPVVLSVLFAVTCGRKASGEISEKIAIADLIAGVLWGLILLLVKMKPAQMAPAPVPEALQQAETTSSREDLPS